MNTKETYRTGAIFGSAGVVAGITLIVFAFTILPDITAFFLLILGVFFTLSHHGTSLDIEMNKVFQYTAIFGMIKTGEKFDLDMFDTIALLPDKESYRIFSKGNRSMDYTSGKVIIVLVSESLNKNIVLLKLKSIDKAQTELKRFASILRDIEVINHINENE